MASSAKLLKILISVLLVAALFSVPVSAQEDTDGDGVVDGDDQCPDTAEGATVDANGCSDAQRNSDNGEDETTTDSDSDGVIDDDDECSGTETGAEVNSVGCAAYQFDTDRDGVPNGEDECPNTPHSEKNEVNRQGCTPFMDETLAESVPIVGRISNGNAISAGTISMMFGGLGWAWRASRVIGVTGGSGKRLKKKYLTRIKKAKSNIDLQIIRKELNKVNDKGKLPDGAYADLMTAQEQRSIVLSNQTSTSQQPGRTVGLRPSKKPKQ
nr:thrombospondin type 3 repeat-containing protein [Euryarchaeota archaeon]